MSNIKVVKVNNIKIGSKSKKKTQNVPPPNIEYLQSIVRNTKKEPTLDLTNTDMISNLLNKKSKKTMDFKVSKKPVDDKDKEDKKDKDKDKEYKKDKDKDKEDKKDKDKDKEDKKDKDKDKEYKKDKDKEYKNDKDKDDKDKKDKDKKLKYKDKEKKIGKKTTTKSIMSFFSKEDQLKIKNKNKNKNKTKRVKKIISSNLNAPKIERKTKRNIYKMGIKKILLKDKKDRKELSKMSRKQLFNELIKNGIIDKESNAPDKVLKDLYQLFLLVEENISK